LFMRSLHMEWQGCLKSTELLRMKEYDEPKGYDQEPDPG
jgi:hypothetical protein